jgi:alpha-D-xyloside xylohydrolase
LLRPTIDTLSPTSEPDRVDSYDTDPGVLYARAVARGSATFTLFDGGTVGQSTEADVTTLSYAGGSELDGGAVFELLDAPAPSSVDRTEASSLEELEMADEGWWYDDAAGSLWVKLASDQSAEIRW